MQKKQKTSFAPHQVRIIGGQWKRTPLAVVDAGGLRPTPDRVRETLFNWLTHLLDGNWNGVACLDLFAGTGALGFEAASRGAAQVLMVEENPAAVRQLEAARDKLKAQQVRIRRGDALIATQELAAQASASGTRFDLVFLDPPYHRDWLRKILPLCKRLLTPDGLVYAEAEMPLTPSDGAPWLDEWEVVRNDKAGMVFYHLLRCKTSYDFEA